VPRPYREGSERFGLAIIKNIDIIEAFVGCVGVRFNLSRKGHNEN